MAIKVFTIILATSLFAFSHVEFPKNCLSSTSDVCHFGTVKKTSQFHFEEIQIYLGQEALLKREQGKIEWVQGPVLFEIDSESTIQIKKNPVVLKKGKYLFFGNDSSVNVEVLEGHFQLGKFQITEGFQATFKWSQDAPDLEPLQPIDFKEHLVRFVKVKNLNHDQAKKYAEEFGPKHKNYVAWAEELNQNLIKRSIAQADSERKQAHFLREKARLAQEKRKLEYFNKVFER